MKKHFLLSIVILISSGAFQASQAELPSYSAATAHSSEVPVQLPAQRTFWDNVWHNKGTYLMAALHLGGIAQVTHFYATTENSLARWAAGIATGAAYFTLCVQPFYASFIQGRAMEDEADLLLQPKNLTSSDWTKKNTFDINGQRYTTGWFLWRSYNNSLKSDARRSFVQKFLNIVMVDSKESTRATITQALNDTKIKLAECSVPSSKYYTNAGLLLGRYFFEKKYPKKRLPANIQNWIWESDEGGDFIKKQLSLDDARFNDYYLEQLLDVEEAIGQLFLTTLDVIEQDFFAHIFSVTEYRTSLSGCHFSWYQFSSWARHGATVRYLALLRHYFFLLGCRALFDQMLADNVITGPQGGTW